MGNEVTQLDSAASEKKEVAEGGSRGVGDQEQGCDTSLDYSDSNRSNSSNQEQTDPASQPGKLFGMPNLKSRRRILIIDDEVAIADTLALIFRSQMYEARVAYSAEQAIEVIAEWRPDLAIMDVILPGMNGIDLAIVTKANYPSCHVILFSGHANTSMLLEEAGRKGHQFEVLAKPVHPSLMLERAADLLGGAEEPAYD
jgi:CheY-like chemotaxis protein